MIKTLVETIAVLQAKAKAGLVNDTQGDVEVKVVVDSLDDMLPKAKKETLPAM